ncbi:hypothetical protein N7468_001333 [Penicillium chermesinum]|uniref:Uncharacterized protein n=1 Tax=Penicillium chermesinum TaxID=63820 RepID=A0A9W9PGI1_9EURO|nr:uncharacterized protein N7468_001333 [Penicillium chermesinum]KAJ5246350.1 hypothetical protein N7468_001333 [Penicillium chermesinum]KAJ6144633.1 hypothetical protein N7470_008528 [Penicillium chermesinum]
MAGFRQQDPTETMTSTAPSSMQALKQSSGELVLYKEKAPQSGQVLGPSPRDLEPYEEKPHLGDYAPGPSTYRGFGTRSLTETITSKNPPKSWQGLEQFLRDQAQDKAKASFLM